MNHPYLTRLLLSTLDLLQMMPQLDQLHAVHVIESLSTWTVAYTQGMLHSALLKQFRDLSRNGLD